MTATRTGRRSGRKTSRKPSAANEERRAEVELAITAFDDSAPDYLLFRSRWESRYAESNLARLWIQAPRAVALHKFATWFGLGRKVRAGEHAIWLKLPRTHRDEDKVSPANPDGEVFTGASWTAMFDFAQTIAVDDFDEDAPGVDPDAVAEVKRLRREAVKLHPDTTMADTAAEFMAAWARYETARARLTEMRTS